MVGNYLLDCLKEIESKRTDIIIEGVVFYEIGDTPLNHTLRYYRDQIFDNDYILPKMPFTFYCRDEEEERMFIEYGKNNKIYLVKESDLINKSINVIKRYKRRIVSLDENLTLDNKKKSKKKSKRNKRSKRNGENH